jgi:hypothetical protein
MTKTQLNDLYDELTTLDQESILHHQNWGTLGRLFCEVDHEHHDDCGERLRALMLEIADERKHA